MKKNVILIIGLVLCSMAVIDCSMAKADTVQNNFVKLVVYVDAQGYTWQQMKNATMPQWLNHCELAGIDPNDLRGTKHTLRRLLIQEKKRIIFENKVTALLVHIRKAGTDVETMPLLREILENWEVYNVDPNAIR